MKFSIRWVVVAGCIILVWGTHLIITPSVYFSTKKVMLRHTRDIMMNVSDLTLKETHNFFSIARGSAYLTKKLIASKVVNADNSNTEKLEQYFLDQLEIYPQFAGIYLALPNGNFYYASRNTPGSGKGFRTKIIQHEAQTRTTQLIWRDRNMNIISRQFDDNDTYDPRQRPWYIKAAREKQIIWTDPYLFFTSNKPGITTAGPIYNRKGEIKGIVGVDIQLDVLSDFISRLRVGKTGLAFMINQNQSVIAFPDLEQLKHNSGQNPGQMRLPEIHELENPICGKAYDAVNWKNFNNGSSQDKSIFASFKFRGRKYFTMFTKVSESKVSWIIGIYIPEEDYFGEINANQKKNQLFALIISIFATIAGIIMASKITRPIYELDQEAQKIKNNDYKSQVEIKSGFIEIQRTARTFHAMKKAVIDYKNRLTAKEKIHSIVTDSVNDAIIMVDIKGTVLYWNMAAEHIFGYTRDEALARNVYPMIIPGKYRRFAEKTLTDFCLTGSREILKTNIEILMVNKDNKIIPVELSVARIKIDNIWHSLAIIRDIAVRKRVEKEKIKMIKQVQQSQKMESIGTLAGGISHDFNNMLYPIMGNAEILKLELPDDSELQENINEIHAATIRASALVKRILTFARPENHGVKPIRIEPVINEALKLMRSTIPATIKIEQDIADDCGVIEADPTHIHQLVMNLATNACHAMENTSGELKLSLKKIFLDEYTIIKPDMKTGEYVLLSMSDTGCGMEKNVMDKIFDPFYTTRKNGTGMGLSMVHGIVSSLKGAIKVSSEPGKGTSFNIYLPVSENLPMDEKDRSSEHALTGTERVLLVDDEKAIIKMEKSILDNLGYTTFSCTDSKKALELFRGVPDNFDLVITDMTMPDMSGDLLAVEIKKIRPDIPIIICTGFSKKISKEKANKLGIEGFLIKPITTVKLSKKIRQVLDG